MSPEGPNLTPDLATGLAEIRAAAWRGRDLVQKLLGFSRQAPLELRTVDLSELLRGLGSMLSRLLPETIRVEIDAPAPARIRGDARAIEQIVLNLATNARDAMPTGGSLTLAVTTGAEASLTRQQSSAGRHHVLSVSDTGVGMDESTRNRAFEPFFTTKPVGTGTGLGMAMVYGLVKQQGGQVEIESASGCGTTVRVLLPALDDARPEATTQTGHAEMGSEDGSPGRHRGTEAILVMEDDDGILSLLRRILAGAGYRVFTARDGEEGLSTLVARRDEIGLVLSDVVMPKLCGRALYTAIREASPSVPVLFMSGYSRRATGECADLARDVPMIRKPWQTSELLERMRALLDAPVTD